MGLAAITSEPVKTRSDAVDEMAPALTEPLSQSKLSSSAASGASPRTSSSTTTTAIDTLGETTIIVSADNFQTELQQQQQQQVEIEADVEHSFPSTLHTDATGANVDEPGILEVVCSSTTPQEAGTTSGELPVAGTAMMSLPASTGNEVGSSTVDDIQNNNNGSGQVLKLDADTNRDLIELALEQLHQEEAMSGAGDGNEAPAMEPMVGTSAADIDSVSMASPMAGNDLQPQNQQPHGDIMSMGLASGQVVLAPETLPDPQQPLHPAQQQAAVQDSSLSSSLGGAAVGSTSECMQLKDTTEMDQMIRDLSTADIDLLQVFKSFDNNSLLLFSDVDVANLCDVPVGDNGQPQSSPNKDRERLEQHAEIMKLQAQMQRKQDFLSRRLSKLMARYMGQHVSEEIAGLFEYTQRFWKKREKEYAKQQHNMATNSGGGGFAAMNESGNWPDIIPYQAPPPDQTPERLKPISANALKTFAKRLESVSNTIRSVQSKRVLNSHYFDGVNSPGNAAPLPTTSSGRGDQFGSGHAPSGGNGAANISNTIPLFDRVATQELEQTAGMLCAELRQVQATIDSDATLSSSGGESADESMPYVNALQEPLPITERAAWKWANGRASVASKWTWVVARIADLEYRIRQHNEVLNKIRINKGPITLEEPIIVGSQQQASTVNGYRGQLPGSSSKPVTLEATAGVENEEDDEAVVGCSRTIPYCRTRFRKRRLMQTHNLHTVSKKAAKCSNVKCGCQWPLLPCALCTGRTDPTAPRDPLDTMTFAERVALLDASYHSVLSFPEDISHTIHMEAFMRSPEWQSKMIRSTASSITEPVSATSSRGQHHHSTSIFSSGDEMVPSSHGRRYTGSDGKRKICAFTSNKYKNNDRTTGGDSVNKSKKAKSRRDVILSNHRKSSSGYSLDGQRSGSNGHRNKNHQAASKSRKSSHSYDYYEGHDGVISRSKNSSPTPNNRNERRYRNNSYDIGSIVIPQSMAASTRVSLPQYKDIAIPKWRIVDDRDDTDENEMMDKEMVISDDPVANLVECDIVVEYSSTVVEENTGIVKTPLKMESSIPPNGTKTGTPSAAASTSAFVENSQQQLIVMPAQDEEDISEEAILLKHDRALQEERKKFRSYLKFPWSRPRAKRRTESRAGSSGGNTPDPTSPAPPTPMLDHDSSPACPSTPLTPQDGQELSEANVINALNKSLHKKERRRTVSSKREEQHAQGAGTITPDTREVISPYDALEFPLADGVFEVMLRSMPSDHIALADDCLSRLTGRNGQPFRRPQHRNNNVLLRVKANVSLAPASLGIGSSQHPLSSNASTASTLSATETDLEDFDDEDLMLAKRTESQLIMERLLNSRSESQQYEIVPPSAKPMLDDDDEAIDDEETDTGESLFVEEDDPNDPEWHDRPSGRSGGGGAIG